MLSHAVAVAGVGSLHAATADKLAQFPANAAECVREAKRARDPKLKAQFEDLAFRWRRLAAEADRLDQRGEK
jgi:hypothetical protein